MLTTHRSPFLTVHTEGSLLPADLLQRVLACDIDLGGMALTDYHLPGNEKLNEAVNHSWNRLQGAWAAFQTSKSRLKDGGPGTTLTREGWLLPLFQELGYGEGDRDRRQGLPHLPRLGEHAHPPGGLRDDLDRRAAGVAGALRTSPDSLVERKEDRYLDLLWKSFRLVHDLDDTRRTAYGVYYTQKKPLTLAALENDLPGI